MIFYLIALLLVTRIPSTLTDDEVSSSETQNCAVKYYFCCEFGNDEDGKLICLKNCPSYDCESEASTIEESTIDLTTPGLGEETTQSAYDEVDLDKPTDEPSAILSIQPIRVIITPIIKCPAGQDRDYAGRCKDEW